MARVHILVMVCSLSDIVFLFVLYCLHLHATISNVCETVIPPDTLKDLIFLPLITYLPVNCTVWLYHFLITVKNVNLFYLPWVTSYLVEQLQAFIQSNLQYLYLNHLVDSSLIGLTLQETYSHSCWLCFTCGLVI